MKVSLAFTESQDERFIVLLAEQPDLPAEAIAAPSVFLFESENSFLENVVAADLSREYLVSVTSTVLLSISQPVFPQRWVTVDLTYAQRVTLGLVAVVKEVAEKPIALGDPKFPIWSFESARQLHDFLMQAPSPFVMLKGSEHVLTFINPPYVELLQRDLGQNLLGMTVREMLPELEGQPFFDLLDQVFRTGIPFVGKEVFGRLKNQRTGEMQDHYFDFVYHPAHDSSGAVFGIFAQAFDVTERVLARQVSQSRESQLYRQWAELDTIYRTAPVGMCLVDAADYRILRINDKLASLAGESAEDLIGQRILEVFPGIPGAEKQLLKAAAGDSIRNLEITTSVRSMPGVLRQWLASFGPLRSANGAVEAIACVTLEVTDCVLNRDELRDRDESPSPEYTGANG